MTGYFERRKSKAAEWCLRIALICVPYFLLTVLMHRSQSVTTEQAFWLIAFGVVMLSTSLLLGLRATADLWEKGYKGGQATVNGMVIAILMLIPLGIQLAYALENPQLSDVATNVFEPPLYLAAREEHASHGEAASEIYDSYQVRQIVSAYPELVARRYEAPPERIANSVMDLLERWHWPVVSSRNLPAQLTADEAEPEGELAGSEGEIGQIAGTGEDQSPVISIQARARSMIMKLPSEVIVRLTPDGDTTLVDMRSSSDWSSHDFGVNARFINAFLTALDQELAGIAGE